MTSTASDFLHSFEAPVGVPIDIAFIFDTTGSMSSALASVKANIRETSSRLLSSIPGLRIAIIAHGDYCDQASTYLTQQLDFTQDAADLTKFVNNVGSTFGGDLPESYEVALHVADSLEWSKNKMAAKAVVLFGDSFPHPASFTSRSLDWRTEALRLHTQGVKIYAVNCGRIEKAELFFSELADITGGLYVNLDKFSLVNDMFMAVCCRETHPSLMAKYEQEVKDREGVLRGEKLESSLHKMFRTLSGSDLLACTTDTGRTCADAWWKLEQDQLLNASEEPKYIFDSTTDTYTRNIVGGLFSSSSPSTPPSTSRKVRSSIKTATMSSTTTTTTTTKAAGAKSIKLTPAQERLAKKRAAKRREEFAHRRSLFASNPYSTPTKPDWYSPRLQLGPVVPSPASPAPSASTTSSTPKATNTSSNQPNRKRKREQSLTSRPSFNRRSSRQMKTWHAQRRDAAAVSVM